MAPKAAATFCTTSRMRRSSRSRTSGSSERAVPVSFARCGMTLKVSPALKVVTETTALCSGSTLRATIDCSAWTIAAPDDDRVDRGVRLGGMAAMALDLER